MTSKTKNNRQVINDLERKAQKTSDPEELIVLATEIQRLGGNSDWIFGKASRRQSERLAVSEARVQA
jgi:hypothetical protein